MTARLVAAIGWLALCALAQACANDTGRPKLDDGFTFGSAGFIGQVIPPVGPAGTGGFGAPTMPTMPTMPTNPLPRLTCREQVEQNSGGGFGFACADCMCAMDEMATLACTADCWKVANCIASHCDPTDTKCIIAACADAVGGAANLVTAASLARMAPFAKCASTCGSALPISDGGPENDF
jgi:hypothetical protein